MVKIDLKVNPKTFKHESGRRASLKCVGLLFSGTHLCGGPAAAVVPGAEEQPGVEAWFKLIHPWLFWLLHGMREKPPGTSRLI